jgi:hypothetical protein
MVSLVDQDENSVSYLNTLKLDGLDETQKSNLNKNWTNDMVKLLQVQMNEPLPMKDVLMAFCESVGPVKLWEMSAEQPADDKKYAFYWLMIHLDNLLCIGNKSKGSLIELFGDGVFFAKAMILESIRETAQYNMFEYVPKLLDLLNKHGNYSQDILGFIKSSEIVKALTVESFCYISKAFAK